MWKQKIEDEPIFVDPNEALEHLCNWEPKYMVTDNLPWYLDALVIFKCETCAKYRCAGGKSITTGL